MEINADKWGDVRLLFEAALQQEPAARQPFLVRNCQDEELRTLLEKLLASHEQAGSFLANAAMVNHSSFPIETHTATFTSGDVLASRFKITRFIAKGGMGEVYEAEDLELREQVAIKTICPDVLQQPRSLARFKREVHLAKQVTHTNVCRIFDLFRHPHASDAMAGVGPVYFVSMELLLGETLAEQLRRIGRMTTAEALPIVIQLASALSAAHNVGILHRDFKPGNIILCPTKAEEGVRAVVTDFGLALRPSGGAFSISVTPLTAHELFGTPAYMSPEQIEGRELTTASDIYALGLVMYQMVAGVRPFETDSAAPISQLIKRLEGPPPSPRMLVPELNPMWESVILKCLECQPGKRFLNAEGVSLALSSECAGIPATMPTLASTAPAGSVEPRQHRPLPVKPEAVSGASSQLKITSATAASTWPKVRERTAWSLAIIALSTIATLLGYLHWRDVKSSSQTQVVRAFINPPEKTEFLLTGDTAGPVAISPDGTKLVFSAGGFLWLRDLNEVTSRRLEGTREAIFPFWSPDSRSIGFTAEKKLKTLDILSGRLVTVCDAPFLRGANWGPGGTILFSPMTQSEIWRVAASGGTPIPVTKLDANLTTHRWPQFLPDGKHFLYFAANHGDPQGTDSAIYIASLDGALNRPLVHSLARAEYASGYLLYIRDRSLVAQPFDLDRLELLQEAVVIAENVTPSISTWGAVFSASQNGILAYQSGGHSTETELRWYDRSGRKLGTLGTGDYLSPRLSPDGSRLVVEFGDPNREIWVFDLKRSVKMRLTFDKYEAVPLWSPDGTWIVFCGGKTHRDADIFRIKSNGQGPREPLYISSDLKIPTDLSSNGRFLLFDNDYMGQTQVYVLPLEGNRKPYPFLPSMFVQRSGHFSADGRWVAYVSRESGSDEVYVAPFPGPGGKWRISNSGGRAPRWRRDGREVFFAAPDNTVMSGEIETKQNKIEVKGVHALFHANFASEFTARAGPYDVIADGSRFLVNVDSDEAIPPITLVLNWPAALKRK